jgi:hypothetical protein
VKRIAKLLLFVEKMGILKAFIKKRLLKIASFLILLMKKKENSLFWKKMV